MKRWRSFWRGFALVAILCGRAGHGVEDVFPDDVGDDPTFAETVTPGAGAIVRIVELDTDEDWYRFSSLPGIAYRVEVACSSLWDAVVTLRAPDGVLQMVTTNSAGSAPPHAVLVCTNRGAAAPYYVGVEGYLRFTTGTYSLAVTAVNWTDTDADGLPDEWEQQWLGGLGDDGDGDADKDGMSNLNEYLAGTHPSNATSRLVITAIEREADAAVIHWPASPYAVYRVTARDEVRSNEWEAIGVHHNMTAAPAALSWPDELAATNRFYRIELLTGE